MSLFWVHLGAPPRSCRSREHVLLSQGSDLDRFVLCFDMAMQRPRSNHVTSLSRPTEPLKLHPPLGIFTGRWQLTPVSGSPSSPSCRPRPRPWKPKPSRRRPRSRRRPSPCGGTRGDRTGAPPSRGETAPGASTPDSSLPDSGLFLETLFCWSVVQRSQLGPVGGSW